MAKTKLINKYSVILEPSEKPWEDWGITLENFNNPSYFWGIGRGVTRSFYISPTQRKLLGKDIELMNNLEIDYLEHMSSTNEVIISQLSQEDQTKLLNYVWNTWCLYLWGIVEIIGDTGFTFINGLDVPIDPKNYAYQRHFINGFFNELSVWMLNENMYSISNPLKLNSATMGQVALDSNQTQAIWNILDRYTRSSWDQTSMFMRTKEEVSQPKYLRRFCKDETIYDLLDNYIKTRWNGLINGFQTEFNEFIEEQESEIDTLIAEKTEELDNLIETGTDDISNILDEWNTIKTVTIPDYLATVKKGDKGDDGEITLTNLRASLTLSNVFITDNLIDFFGIRKINAIKDDAITNLLSVTILDDNVSVNVLVNKNVTDIDTLDFEILPLPETPQSINIVDLIADNEIDLIFSDKDKKLTVTATFNDDNTILQSFTIKAVSI